MKKWHTREDSGLRVDREGRWWHDDELVEHPKIIEAFNVGLQPSEDGRFILRFGQDWAYVQVADAAYRVVGVDEMPDAVALHLSDRTTETLVPETLCLDDEGVLVCRVKKDRAWARFSRDAQFQLGSVLEDSPSGLALRLGEKRYPIAPR